MGLVRFEAEKNSAFGRLTCLHVWLLLITCAVNDPILLNWGFDDYDEIQHFHNPEKVSLGAQLWQNFERFASDFQIDASQLPARSGIIHQNNWKEYLGPFSGRVFIYANVIPSDINTSSRCWLSGIDGIGRKYADIIIKKRPYQSLEINECYTLNYREK
ncbi:hypothetical protein C2G38_2044035 [Gigaspora rosea]|uniref:Uncharacterized protein n=1 Tax=Gigaspora rosea TaxID=44941 RepID=A0A397UHU0_9GLOM|nr:hypothetical protein C2G38_2044035 [Gigaspora rosea]